MKPTDRASARPSSHSRAMPLLRCRFGAADFLLPLERVVEILRYTRPTPVPGTAPWIAGVMNLRGRIHPVVDLAVKFGYAATVADVETCVVLVHGPARDGGAPIGLISGQVTTIHDLKRGNLDPPRARAGGVRAEFLEGSFKTANGLAFVLHLERVLAAEGFVGSADAAPAGNRS